MSGIVGILNLDGTPADTPLLQRLTYFLRTRGPDAQRQWTEGSAGLGHALFKTGPQSEADFQPATLGSGIWIVADARIDAQHDLVQSLRVAGHEPPPGSTDAELILWAYETWGESCVDHLLGDFAFGIWDSRRRVLFCARDQMGVRPFYYAQIRSFLIFSSSLDCIRQLPIVSDRLNELAVADFLLFGLNQDTATTTFAEIQRLPPAHCATYSSEGMRIKRYWTMPIDEPIFYKRKDDYCERFREILDEAVGDRIRSSRVGVFMSGGLDSPTLAATARNVLRRRYPNFDLFALTDVDDFKPEEGLYAGMIAKHLGIPIYFDKWDDEPVDPRWEVTPFRTAEPRANGWDVLPNRAYRERAGSLSRVFFWGEGPDGALLQEWRPYLDYMLKRRQYRSLLGGLVSALAAQPRFSFGRRISRKIGEFFKEGMLAGDAFPIWLNPDFEERLRLRARWEEMRFSAQPSAHPVRPRGYASLQTPTWHSVLEPEDAGSRGTCFEMRHPFADPRVLRFMLSVPPLPWCRSKYLLRRSMRADLPDPVLRRKKRGLPGDRIMKRVGTSGLEPFRPVQGIMDYIDPHKVPDIPNDDLWIFGGHLRVRSLNHWLQYSQKKMHNAPEEAGANEFIAKGFVGG